MKRLVRLLVVLILPAIVILGSQALISQAFNFVTAITIPGGVASNDIFFGDATLGRAYLADRTNAGVDVFDVRNNNFIGRIPAGGVGTATAPNGVATDAANQLVFAGLGASGRGGGFLMANAVNNSVIARISMPKPSGGPATGRSDEFAVAPGLGLILVANDQDSPPFMTEISYTPAGVLTIVGQIEFPTQTGCGIEQTVWVPESGQFMTALPKIGGCPGGIAVFNPVPLTLASTIPTDCSPQGMAHGPVGLMFVGCSPAPEVISLATGAKVATLGTLPSSDEVWFDPGASAYEFLIGAPVNTLNIYSAATNLLIESDPTGGAFHNLTADAATGKVFVALDAGNATCAAGCSAVFAPPTVVGPSVPVGTGRGFAPAAGPGVTCGGGTIVYPSASWCVGGNPAPAAGPGVTCPGSNIVYPSAAWCSSARSDPASSSGATVALAGASFTQTQTGAVLPA